MNILFINENESILDTFKEHNIVNSLTAENLSFISEKQKNNYIGYYQFKYEEDFVKVYILPKTQKRVSNEKENIKNFFLYLKKYYDLKGKHDYLEPKLLNNNIVDLDFDSIDKFIFSKYMNSLKNIEIFFKKHNNYKLIKKEYSSQSVKSNLNIRKNIIETNKSIIHQNKKENIYFSKYAVICDFAIKFFKRNVLKNIDDIDNQLYNYSSKVSNFINKKFPSDNSFTVKFNYLLSQKIKKLFKHHDEKILYHSVLVLLGMDEYDNHNKKFENIISIFFRPERLYELQVFDYLKNNFPYETIKTAFKYETSSNYNLIGNEKKYYITSNPDFIIEKENEILIIDAKWKILKTTPDLHDILKLERDSNLIKTQKTKISIFIYPQILINDDSFEVEYNNFKFKIMNIPII